MESVPDVEKQRFANLMSSGTSILLRRVTQVEPAGANDRVTPPLTLYTALLSSAAAFEAPQVNGFLQKVTTDFTHGVIEGFRGRVTHETSVQDDPKDFDSDNSSEDDDNEATTGLGLQQQKVQFHNT
jgi:hypothetical protein